MDDSQIWAYIDEQRADLADFLDTLSAEQWETPSLCPGWTVREVAAHITQSATNWGKLTFELARSGFRFNAVMLRMARDDQRTPERDHRRAEGDGRRSPQATGHGDGGPADGRARARTGHRRTPRLERAMPVPAAVVAAQRVWTMGFPFNARKQFPNVTFTATDADFSVGTGEVVLAPIQDILMTLSGRRAGLPVE